jgi:predicted N-acetyltransferase YhbS
MAIQVMCRHVSPKPGLRIIIPMSLKSDTAQITSRAVAPFDYPELQALHDRVFGPGAYTRTAYRVREGMPPQSSFCRVITLGDQTGSQTGSETGSEQIIASIRFTPINIGTSDSALLLGPLAVDPDHANQGHGRRLINEGLTHARSASVALVLLIGDASYYERLGFENVQPGHITLAGPFDPQRLLAAHLDETRSRSMRGLVVGAPKVP